MIAFFYDSWFVILKYLMPGIFLGAVYDVFRLARISRNDSEHSVKKALRKRFYHKEDSDNQTSKRQISEYTLVLIEDILFFIIVAITEILAVYHFNGGEIRVYCLLISAVGFFIYQKTLGILLIFLSRRILYLIRKTIYLIICIALTPIFFLSSRVVRLWRILLLKRKNQTQEDKPRKDV